MKLPRKYQNAHLGLIKQEQASHQATSTTNHTTVNTMVNTTHTVATEMNTTQTAMEKLIKHKKAFHKAAVQRLWKVTAQRIQKPAALRKKLKKLLKIPSHYQKNQKNQRKEDAVAAKRQRKLQLK